MADFVGTGGSRDHNHNRSVSVVDAFLDDDEEVVYEAFPSKDEDEDEAGNGNGNDSEVVVVDDDDDYAHERRITNETQKNKEMKKNTIHTNSSTARHSKMQMQYKENPKLVITIAAAIVLLSIKIVQKLFQDPRRGLMKHRCNRCAKKDARVKCNRCKKAYYCSRECLKAAWKLEICECC